MKYKTLWRFLWALLTGILKLVCFMLQVVLDCMKIAFVFLLCLGLFSD